MYIFSFFIVLQGLFVCFSLGSGLLGFLTAGHEFTIAKQFPTPFFRQFNAYHSSTKRIRKTTTGYSRPVKNRSISYSSDGKLTYSLNRLARYVSHLKNSGSNAIKYTHKKINHHLTNDKKNQMMIYPVTTDYAAKIDNYFEFIKQYHKNTTLSVKTGKKARYIFPDGELVILNMLEKSCELLYRQQWQLVNTTPMNTTRKYMHRIQFISKVINKQINNWKKKEMHHICIYYRICMPYPAFTDHLEHLTVELLYLPDEKLKTFMYTLKQLVMNNKDFLAVLAEVKGKPITFKEVEDICNNTTLKESLTVLRSVIELKFKISTAKSSFRLQAAKVLFDIIDKAFQFHHSDNIDLEFEHLISAIRNWNYNKRPLDASLVERLINNTLQKLLLIEHPAKGVLIETLIRGDLAQNKMNNKFQVVKNKAKKI